MEEKEPFLVTMQCMMTSFECNCFEQQAPSLLQMWAQTAFGERLDDHDLRKGSALIHLR